MNNWFNDLPSFAKRSRAWCIAAAGLLISGIHGYNACAASDAVPGGFELATHIDSNRPAAWGDFNGDGWVDLYTQDKLYRNDNGSLTAMPGNEKLVGNGLWGDSNNNGLLDFFTWSGNHPKVHINQGDGVFQTIALPGFKEQTSLGAAWGDFNGDGFADLYVGGYEKYPVAYYCDQIAFNQQDGTYAVAWTQELDAVTTRGRPRPARGITTADWDRDGDLDIYVSNYRLEPNALWQNDGKGSFRDVAVSHNAVATSRGYSGGHSIGAAWGDFDNDGLLDLFAGNFAHRGQPQSRFLRNRGAESNYQFEDMGTGGIAYQESYASPIAGDIDNDGDLDLYFTTVYTHASGGIENRPVLYRNDGNFHFTNITKEWGLPTAGKVATYQAAFADYDNDGYLDLITNGDLYKNSGGDSHWLKVRLDGGKLFGALPVGTQVVIKREDLSLLRQVESGVGQGNQNDPTLHFGLGDYAGSLDLEIYWPGGMVQKVHVEGVDQLITVAVPKP